MDRYAKKQLVLIIEHYFKNFATVWIFRSKYGPNNGLISLPAKRLSQKFYETRSISDLSHSGRPSTSRATENMEASRESVAEKLRTSIRHYG